MKDSEYRELEAMEITIKAGNLIDYLAGMSFGLGLKDDERKVWVTNVSLNLRNIGRGNVDGDSIIRHGILDGAAAGIMMMTGVDNITILDLDFDDNEHETGTNPRLYGTEADGFDPDCSYCQQDRHVCPGCGNPTSHAQSTCHDCS
jgi:hypothetical protein